MKQVRMEVLLAIAALAAAPALAQDARDPQLRALLAEAAANNPDLRAAQREVDAARNRVAPAEALDDPMLEAGVVNLPAQSRSFTREDMTMKMIGLTQRLPYPGKRGLRRDVAEREAASAEHNLRETGNRVRRDVKNAYVDLALVHESQRLA